MEITRWKKIEEVFNGACELPESLRQEYLDRNCAGDLNLLDEVLNLLVHDKALNLLFDSPLKNVLCLI